MLQNAKNELLQTPNIHFCPSHCQCSHSIQTHKHTLTQEKLDADDAENFDGADENGTNKDTKIAPVKRRKRTTAQDEAPVWAGVSVLVGVLTIVGLTNIGVRWDAGPIQGLDLMFGMSLYVKFVELPKKRTQEKPGADADEALEQPAESGAKKKAGKAPAKNGKQKATPDEAPVRGFLI